jgi:hypothetical protein
VHLKNPHVRAHLKIQLHFAATSGGKWASWFIFHVTLVGRQTHTHIEHNAIIRDVYTLHNRRFPLTTQTSQSKLTIGKKEDKYVAFLRGVTDRQGLKKS